MIRATCKSLLLFATAAASIVGLNHADAQAVATASGPGTFVSVGVTASAFQQDYGQRYVGGEAIFVDANVYRRIGVEAEGRFLNAFTSESVKQSTYLVGPKISALPRHFRPYVKLLAGRGTLDFPFHYAVGHYFVVAPGAGLDLHLNNRMSIRVADVEYQIWPQFTYGQLHPYGISSGISFDVFSPGGSPRGRHFNR